ADAVDQLPADELVVGAGEGGLRDVVGGLLPAGARAGHRALQTRGTVVTHGSSLPWRRGVAAGPPRACRQVILPVEICAFQPSGPSRRVALAPSLTGSSDCGRWAGVHPLTTRILSSVSFGRRGKIQGKRHDVWHAA